MSRTKCDNKAGSGLPTSLRWIRPLTEDAEFGKDLKASFVSDFRVNESEQLDRDIKDVADDRILKELRSGALVIRTIRDYCEHMVRCYRANPDEVKRLLAIQDA